MALNAGRGDGRLFAHVYINLSVIGFPCHGVVDQGCIARPFPSSRARAHHELAAGHLPAAPARAREEATAPAERRRLEFGRRPRPASPDRPG
jgi:hypothetical protein